MQNNYCSQIHKLQYLYGIEFNLRNYNKDKRA